MPEPVFVPQFHPAESIEEHIANRDQEDRNLPAWNWCGICCVRMIALGLKLDPPSLEDMYETAFQKHAVFKWVDGQVVGAYHEALATYIREAFGIEAKAVRRRSAKDILRLVEDGAWFIASVSADIRNQTNDAPEKKIGHLVLLFDTYGDDDTDGFVLHNSAGFSCNGSQAHARVSTTRFADCFSGCGILILPTLAR